MNNNLLKLCFTKVLLFRSKNVHKENVESCADISENSFSEQNKNVPYFLNYIEE
jgi:hypothetical protein